MSQDMPDAIGPVDFARGYIEAYPRLCSIAAREVGWTWAEDVVQRAAMICIGKISEIENQSELLAWMSGVVRHVAKNHRRSEQRRTRRDHPRGRSPENDPLPLFPPHHAAPADAVHETLLSALDTLHPQHRVCLILKVVMGHSFAQISEILCIPEATARSHAHRARVSLALTLSRVAPDDLPRSAAETSTVQKGGDRG